MYSVFCPYSQANLYKTYYQKTKKVKRTIIHLFRILHYLLLYESFAKLYTTQGLISVPVVPSQLLTPNVQGRISSQKI